MLCISYYISGPTNARMYARSSFSCAQNKVTRKNVFHMKNVDSLSISSHVQKKVRKKVNVILRVYYNMEKNERKRYWVVHHGFIEDNLKKKDLPTLHTLFSPYFKSEIKSKLNAF